MSKLPELLKAAVNRESVQAGLAVLIVIGVFAHLFLKGSIPAELYALAGAVVGFYFGGAARTNGVEAAVRRVMSKDTTH